MSATLCTTFVLSPSIPSLVQFFLISLYIKLRWWNSWFLSPCCGSNNITQSESNWKWTPLRCPKRPDQLIGSLGPISVQRRPLIKCGFQDFLSGWYGHVMQCWWLWEDAVHLAIDLRLIVRGTRTLRCVSRSYVQIKIDCSSGKSE